MLPIFPRAQDFGPCRNLLSARPGMGVMSICFIRPTVIGLPVRIVRMLLLFPRAQDLRPCRNFPSARHGTTVGSGFARPRPPRLRLFPRPPLFCIRRHRFRLWLPNRPAPLFCIRRHRFRLWPPNRPAPLFCIRRHRFRLWLPNRSAPLFRSSPPCIRPLRIRGVQNSAGSAAAELKVRR